MNPININREHAQVLTDLLSNSSWPFHAKKTHSVSSVHAQFGRGYYTGSGIKSFVFTDEAGKAWAYIRLFDLGADEKSAETPLFDLRIAANERGKGRGTDVLQWTINWVFENYPQKNRIEATTRFDNYAMRKVLMKCGFVKEAHYRESWPLDNDELVDCVGYALLKRDWLSGNTSTFNFGDF